MNSLSVGFIRSSLIYIMYGILVGATMAFPGGYGWLSSIGAGNPTLSHAHANLLGFMLMMVFGVAYHIFPRFTGNPVRRPWMAWANFWCCQAGTAGMVLGFLFRGVAPWLLPIAGIVQAVGITMFVVVMWQVVRPMQRIMPR